MRIACLAVAMLLSGCQPTPAPATRATSPAVAAPAVIAPAGESTPSAAATTDASSGRISGTLSYPSEFLPPMRVCAFELAEATPYCVLTDEGQAQYRIEGVPPGDYLVLAFPHDPGAPPGGYTGCVADLRAGCGDHDLKPIIVAAGQTTPDIDPADYYADAADWPQEPAP
jgi:hypothetical protein